MAEWFTLEVQNGQASAGQWADAFGDEFVSVALSNGATNWEWHRPSWGVLLEIEFVDEESFERFRKLPFVTAALDEVPDPQNGLIFHRGRGGSSGNRDPRRTRPLLDSGAEALPIPEESEVEDDFVVWLVAEETRTREPQHT